MPTALRSTLPRPLTILLAALGAVAVLAAPALAHVTVRTDNPAADGFAVYTVRVPNERDDSGTTTVEVQIPDGLDASRYEPIPGWDIAIAEGVLTATGGVIEPGQFLDIRFQARNPAEPTQLSFAAIQTYESGEVVEWTGGEDSDTPASVVEIVAAAADGGHGASGGHGEDDAEEAATEEAMTEEAMTEEAMTEGAATEAEDGAAAASSDGGSSTIAVVALVAGLLGLGLGGAAFARSRRP
jgi:uncharacterized protein YcnI